MGEIEKPFDSEKETTNVYTRLVGKGVTIIGIPTPVVSVTHCGTFITVIVDLDGEEPDWEALDQANVVCEKIGE